MIEGISPHIVHLGIAFLLGGLVMRWRDVVAFLRWIMQEPMPDPADPYEDAVHDPTWGDVDMEGGHALVLPTEEEAVRFRNEWQTRW